VDGTHTYYANQQDAPWFQGSQSTFISTHMLVQQYNLLCSAHVSFGRGAGAPREAAVVAIALPRPHTHVPARIHAWPLRPGKCGAFFAGIEVWLCVRLCARARAEAFNATCATMRGVQPGNCPPEFLPGKDGKRAELNAQRFREIFLKWRVRCWAEKMGELDKLKLEGVSIEKVDKVLNGGFNERIRRHFTIEYGGHACGVKGESGIGDEGGGSDRRQHASGRPIACAVIRRAPFDLCGPQHRPTTPPSRGAHLSSRAGAGRTRLSRARCTSTLSATLVSAHPRAQPGL